MSLSKCPLALACILLPAVPLPVFAQSHPSIRSVDFRNFTYSFPKDPSLVDPESPIVLHNGKTVGTDPDDFEISRLTAVRYADFAGHGEEYAAVAIRTPRVARRGEDDDFYVYAYRGGTLRQVFFAEYSSGAKMQVLGRSFVILWPDGTEEHPEWKRTIYRWHNNKFIASSPHA